MFLTALAGATAASALGAPRAFAGPLMDPAQAARRYAGRAPTQWGMSMPGVVSTFPADGRQLALTLDACDGACDDALLATLRRYRVPAVLFVCSKWIDANPGRVERLGAAGGHGVGRGHGSAAGNGHGGPGIAAVAGARAQWEATSLATPAARGPGGCITNEAPLRSGAREGSCRQPRIAEVAGDMPATIGHQRGDTAATACEGERH